MTHPFYISFNSLIIEQQYLQNISNFGYTWHQPEFRYLLKTSHNVNILCTLRLAPAFRQVTFVIFVTALVDMFAWRPLIRLGTMADLAIIVRSSRNSQF